MQQHVISTISLMVAAGSAILAIIFFAIYLILRVKNGGARKQVQPAVPDNPKKPESLPDSVDLLAPPAASEEKTPPASDHFKTVDAPTPEPANTETQPVPENDGEIRLSYEEVMRKYFDE